MYESITYTIEITYKIKGYEHLCFGKDKRLYNVKTGRVKKQSLNGGSIGYWVTDKKFLTIKNIKENNLLIKPKKNILPF